MRGFLLTGKKENCFGCEACVQVCPKRAIKMAEDTEGFRYPVLDTSFCVRCGLCNQVCPVENMPEMVASESLVFGGYHKDNQIKKESTSGGAFSAIVEAWCDRDYVIFGAAAEGLRVYHDYITDKCELQKFRKSKYSQSEMGSAYRDAKRFLAQGKKVLFSGTPCQIAGLRSYLGDTTDFDNLLTVEVICEGVPTPLFIRAYDREMQKRYGAQINQLDYRYKDMKPLGNPIFGRWDFQVMRTSLQNGKTMKRDRWFNPFWSIWLQHLMSRPSCYICPFAKAERVADISLGDLWGVHLYCPELYGKNGGASLIICNTRRGKGAFHLARRYLYGHELDFATALKYQGPMRKYIDSNPNRDRFMQDIQMIEYDVLCKKWAKRPTLKLLYQKYIWGNRNKIALWRITGGRYHIH